MAMGDRAGALADLWDAVQLSSRFRLEVPPASSSLTSADEMFDRFVFSSFIEAAAQEAVRTGNQRWAEKAFEAVELNRAASLRESRELADVWHRKVPPAYWETLAHLHMAEVKAFANGETIKSRGVSVWNLQKWRPKRDSVFLQRTSRVFTIRVHLYIFNRG